MTGQQAEKIVLGTGVVVGAVVVRDSLRRTGSALPPPPVLVSGIVLFAGLSLAAGVLPDVAGPAAILLGAAVVLSRIGGGNGGGGASYRSRPGGARTVRPQKL